MSTTTTFASIPKPTTPKYTRPRNSSLPASTSYPVKSLVCTDSDVESIASFADARIVLIDSVRSQTPSSSIHTSQTLRWTTNSERTVAVGTLEIHRVKSTGMCFLKSGNFLHAIFARSQCWCVGDKNTLVLKIPDGFYRIELLAQTDAGRDAVEVFKQTLGTVLLLEKTTCPFRCSPILENKTTAEPVKAVPTSRTPSTDQDKRVRHWKLDGVWRRDTSDVSPCVSSQNNLRLRRVPMTKFPLRLPVYSEVHEEDDYTSPRLRHQPQHFTLSSNDSSPRSVSDSSFSFCSPLRNDFLNGQESPAARVTREEFSPQTKITTPPQKWTLMNNSSIQGLFSPNCISVEKPRPPPRSFPLIDVRKQRSMNRSSSDSYGILLMKHEVNKSKTSPKLREASLPALPVSSASDESASIQLMSSKGEISPITTPTESGPRRNEEKRKDSRVDSEGFVDFESIDMAPCNPTEKSSDKEAIAHNVYCTKGTQSPTLSSFNALGLLKERTPSIQADLTVPSALWQASNTSASIESLGQLALQVIVFGSFQVMVIGISFVWLFILTIKFVGMCIWKEVNNLEWVYLSLFERRITSETQDPDNPIISDEMRNNSKIIIS